MKIRIPQYDNIRKLNYKYLDSTVKQYYKPLVRGPMIKRLQLALMLIGDEKKKRLLDVGFGGGTFFPELSTRCEELFGIDVHPEIETVKKMLEKEDIKADISNGSILNIAHPDGFFDCVVCMSVLEHLEGETLKNAVREMSRVLAVNGKCIIGVPVKNKISDAIIDKILKFKPDEIHPTSHSMALDALTECFDLKEEVHYPFFMPLDWSLYTVFSFIKKR
ncbi:MAG: class I SAM-dependent methyltransferase [PVC group bacterium]|nr:class I SAM-dependent methyltransferase [PVC group bacterium]